MFLELSFTMIALSFLCGATLLVSQELYINEQTIVRGQLAVWVRPLCNYYGWRE